MPVAEHHLDWLWRGYQVSNESAAHHSRATRNSSNNSDTHSTNTASTNTDSPSTDTPTTDTNPNAHTAADQRRGLCICSEPNHHDERNHGRQHSSADEDHA
jgi:hypothetical protein